ncbi:unnamed protein product [Lepeophtheirus salmonis]|uniref:(salmon louse) hypothetical protein n=1 Tax=Lepeophtheirus salmonis TaxID=72036 RepID=A0A7R8H410_LEPSM|nr:unnamed protein product [Lepeophtheirus salmonis]CAF2851546.1 unnamed protein product [Lepeophtheirus salmonis]
MKILMILGLFLGSTFGSDINILFHSYPSPVFPYHLGSPSQFYVHDNNFCILIVIHISISLFPIQQLLLQALSLCPFFPNHLTPPSQSMLHDNHFFILIVIQSHIQFPIQTSTPGPIVVVTPVPVFLSPDSIFKTLTGIFLAVIATLELISTMTNLETTS